MGAFDWFVDTVNFPVMDIQTPRNVKMCAIFGRSFAYFTVKERLPIIITKVIDHLSKDRDDIAHEFGELARDDVKQVIAYLSKLKNEIQTNKTLEPITVQSDDTEEWNGLIKQLEDPYYFTCVWLFTECYVYRRIREAFQLTSSLSTMDPFRIVKDSSFMHSMMAMCMVANHITKMLVDDRHNQEDFQMMLRLNLWGNKCDLSLSVGKEVSQDTNPIAMVELLHNNIIVDDSATVYGQLARIQAENNPTAGKGQSQLALNKKKSKEKTSSKEGTPEKDGKEIIVDIVCDNAGYELYMDFCFADYLITKKLATHVRFHVKQIPWFVSDASVRDVQWAVSRASAASFSQDLPMADSTSMQTLNSQNLVYLGNKWQGYLKSNIWSCKDDHFWTTPHEFYKMPSIDKELYTKLGEATMVFFKGDLNYRKLMGEVNWPPTTPFEVALREFFPCPLVAVRTVKADLISGLQPGVQEKLNKLDEKWMEKGDYGVIQYSSKSIILSKEVVQPPLPPPPDPSTIPPPPIIQLNPSKSKAGSVKSATAVKSAGKIKSAAKIKK